MPFKHPRDVENVVAYKTLEFRREVEAEAKQWELITFKMILEAMVFRE